jgi:enamine deaminase RidA (YjgF/YER057c/UK114 family)
MGHWSNGAVTAVVALLLCEGAFSMQERRTVATTPPGPFSQSVTAGGFVFAGAVNGIDVTARGDDNIQTQTARAIDRLQHALDAAGSSLEQTLNVSVYLRRAGDFDAMNTVYRERFAVDPPARTTVVSDLTDGALVEMSALAVPNGTPREVLHPAGWAKSPRPYSYVVRSNGLVLFAGLVSRRPGDDQIVPGSVSLQTRTILENAGSLLRAAGLSYEHVVSARAFLTDDSMFDAMNDEYRRVFTSDPPARATVVSGLMGSEPVVEIAFIASSRESKSFGPTVWPTLPISTGVRTGSLWFLSGVMGDTEANHGDVAAQTREALTRIARTLDAAGLSLSDVADCTIYLPDVSQSVKADAVFREFFPNDPPVRSQNPNEIPVATEFDVRLQNPLSSKTSQVEDRFEATTMVDLRDERGRVMVPAGSVMRGVVSSVNRATRTDRKGAMTVAFDRVTINGRSYPIRATVSQALESEGIMGEKQKIGIGAGAGAILGAILGGAKGALAGILIGGGGTIAATEGKDVELPAGTVLRVRLDSPLVLGR